MRPPASSAVLALCYALAAGACASKQADSSASRTPESAVPAGAKLWASRCLQCHVVRAPGSYSDNEWVAIMLHMRVRANMVPAEQEAILRFLKTAN